MQSNVRQKILAGVSVSVSVLSSISAQEVTKEPNIIIIMADQLRVDLLQREGYPLNTMPFADNLAKKMVHGLTVLIPLLQPVVRHVFQC